MNIAKKSLLVNLISVVIVLSACGQKTSFASVSTLPAKTATMPSTAYPLPISTATTNQTQKENIEEKCPTILPSAELSKIKTEGVVVLLKSRYLDIVRQAYLLNLANNELIEFSKQGENLSYYAIAISPDNRTLAYSIISPKDETIQLILSNNLGERQKIIPLKSDIPYPMYGTIGGWLNDQQLILDREILNPYTGENQKFNPKDFPDISPDDFGVYFLQYDPTLTRVIYSHSHATTALTNLVTKQVLAEVRASYAGVPKIAWSPNGNYVAIVGASQSEEKGADEVFIVDRDGKKIEQLTHLSMDYPSSVIFNLSWSPDSSQIAFWQKDFATTMPKLRLFVLNTKTEQLTSYCTWGTSKDITFYGPIWSPDGTELLIGDRRDKQKIRPVVIDINRNLAVPVAEDMIPVGWMVSP